MCFPSLANYRRKGSSVLRKSDVRKFFARSAGDRWLALESLICLAVARMLVLTTPFRLAVGLLGLLPGEASPDSTSATGLTVQIGWALRAAAARTPWQSTCLVQALGGAAMLLRRRMPVTLVLGVAKDTIAEGGLSAHAWLCSGGAVLTGGNGMDRFTAVAVFRKEGTERHADALA